MAKKLLSFLGTNAYLHTVYELDGKQSQSVRYVQEALAELICKEWSENDEIIIFATTGENGSIKKNWEQGYINKFDEFGKQFEKIPKGLNDRLNDLQLNCKISMKPIPDGLEEGEIWTIIHTLYDSINEKDQIYFDITHSFRFIPMIVPAIISFLKTTKRVDLQAIHYGAFEALGSLQEVTKIPLEKRIAPIRELSEIYEMIDWSVATNAFLLFGSGKFLIDKLDNLKRKSNFDKKTRNIFQPIKKNIEKIDAALKFNDVRNLKPENVKLESKIDLSKTPSLFTLKKIAPSLEKYIKQWSNDEVRNGLLAAKWHLEYDRFAQALTFAHESLITYFCELFNWDKSNKYHRSSVDFALQVYCEGKDPNDYNNEKLKQWFLEQIEEVKHKLDSIDKDIICNFHKIRNWRNTVNHAKEGDRKKMIKDFPPLLEKIFNILYSK